GDFSAVDLERQFSPALKGKESLDYVFGGYRFQGNRRSFNAVDVAARKRLHRQTGIVGRGEGSTEVADFRWINDLQGIPRRSERTCRDSILHGFLELAHRGGKLPVIESVHADGLNPGRGICRLVGGARRGLQYQVKRLRDVSRGSRLDRYRGTVRHADSLGC